MALGDQSKALRIMSKAQGWDPTVIQGTGESIANFDKGPDRPGSGDHCVGRLPADPVPDPTVGFTDEPAWAHRSGSGTDGLSSLDRKGNRT